MLGTRSGLGPQRRSVGEICRNTALFLDVAQYGDVSLSGCVYSRVKINAIVEAFGSANLGGELLRNVPPGR